MLFEEIEKALALGASDLQVFSVGSKSRVYYCIDDARKLVAIYHSRFLEEFIALTKDEGRMDLMITGKEQFGEFTRASGGTTTYVCAQIRLDARGKEFVTLSFLDEPIVAI